MVTAVGGSGAEMGGMAMGVLCLLEHKLLAHLRDGLAAAREGGRRERPKSDCGSARGELREHAAAKGAAV